MSPLRTIRITVNGCEHELEVEPRWTLADVLRDHLGLTGTHLGCEHGVCGACTVLLEGEAVRSCLLFAVQANGHQITTIEGLACGDELHPLQSAFQEHHSLHCGFCTPGFVLSAYAFLKDHPHPSEEEVRVAMSGNLCRCTGYQGIVKAVLATAARMRD